MHDNLCVIFQHFRKVFLNPFSPLFLEILECHKRRDNGLSMTALGVGGLLVAGETTVVVSSAGVVLAALEGLTPAACAFRWHG